MTAMADRVTPRAGAYRVLLRPPVDRTAGGIWLPENWVVNWTDARVLAAGPGLAVGDNGARGVMWAEPGDVVLFQKHDFSLMVDRIGFVSDDRLIGFFPAGDDRAFTPLNDWVKIQQDPELCRESPIALPEAYEPRPMSGRVRDWGPGRRLKTGRYAGLRRSIQQELNLPQSNLRGLHVHWGPECEVLACGREALEFLLIRAEDLLFYEEEE